jgi:hypothetical protein
VGHPRGHPGAATERRLQAPENLGEHCRQAITSPVAFCLAAVRAALAAIAETNFAESDTQPKRVWIVSSEAS